MQAMASHQSSSVGFELLASNTQLLGRDKLVVGRHVRSDLFETTIFLPTRSALNFGGTLHTNYLEKCQPLLAMGQLVGKEDADVVQYINYNDKG